MTIQCNLTNIILKKLFCYLQTSFTIYKHYIHVGFLKRNFLKKEISENQGIFKKQGILKKECFEKSRNLGNKGNFYKTRNSKTGEF